MKFPSCRSWIAIGALLIVTVVMWRSMYSGSDAPPKAAGTQKPQRDIIHPSSTTEPQRDVGNVGSNADVGDKTNAQHDHRIVDAVAAVTPRARSLLWEWEEKSFRPLEFANTLLRNAAALVIPPPDDETEGALHSLMVGALGDASTDLQKSAIDEVKAAVGWPEHSRVVIAQSVAEADDSVMVIDNADEKNIRIDPVTGAFSFSAHTRLSLDALDLRIQNRYSHLFEVAGER